MHYFKPVLTLPAHNHGCQNSHFSGNGTTNLSDILITVFQSQLNVVGQGDPQAVNLLAREVAASTQIRSIFQTTGLRKAMHSSDSNSVKTVDRISRQHLHFYTYNWLGSDSVVNQEPIGSSQLT
uniref:Uncharacterized protein n=1 Tax=Micrurus lemniscatus lemniscatus TaxID=129467 RepID=A0A2D4H8U5_MICLE